MNLVLVEQSFDRNIAVLDQLLKPCLRATYVALVGALLVDDENSGSHA
jgi:hypothetical protein